MKSTIENKVESIRLSATGWAAFPDVDDVRPIGNDDREVLAEIRDVLIKHGATSRFGVNLIHRHFDLKADEVLFETTDVENRVQQMEVRPVSILKDHKNVLETQWVFDDKTRATMCVGGCHYNFGHKRIHNRR